MSRAGIRHAPSEISNYEAEDNKRISASRGAGSLQHLAFSKLYGTQHDCTMDDPLGESFQGFSVDYLLEYEFNRECEEEFMKSLISIFVLLAGLTPQQDNTSKSTKVSNHDGLFTCRKVYLPAVGLAFTYCYHGFVLAKTKHYSGNLTEREFRYYFRLRGVNSPNASVWGYLWSLKQRNCDWWLANTVGFLLDAGSNARMEVDSLGRDVVRMVIPGGRGVAMQDIALLCGHKWALQIVCDGCYQTQEQKAF